MKIRAMVISFMCVMFVGCYGFQKEQRNISQQIIGKWDWLDIRHMTPQFNRAVVEFKSSGDKTLTMWSRDDVDPYKRTIRYFMQGDVLWHEADTNTLLRVTIKGEKMNMTFIKAVSPDDIGKVLHFKRLALDSIGK